MNICFMWSKIAKAVPAGAGHAGIPRKLSKFVVIYDEVYFIFYPDVHAGYGFRALILIGEVYFFIFSLFKTRSWKL
jgi:hypothetical protein